MLEKWLCLLPPQEAASSLRSSRDQGPGLLPPAPPSSTGCQMSASIVPGKRGARAEGAERATHWGRVQRGGHSWVATHSLFLRLWGMLGLDPRFPTSQHTPSL